MIKLSILTPAIPMRWGNIEDLIDHLDKQIARYEPEIEHLVLIDNCARAVGEKRQALLDIAKGQYIAFVDDDDWVEKNYVERLMEAIEKRPDVITFRQCARINGVEGEIVFRAGHKENEAWKANGISTRPPWHVCAWRRTLALRSSFPATNYGEDWAWAAPLQQHIRTEEHIPEVLHYYQHCAQTTAAPHPDQKRMIVEAA